MEENDNTEDVFTPWPEDWDYSKDIEKLNVRILLLGYRFLKKNFFSNRYSWIFIVQIYNGHY